MRTSRIWHGSPARRAFSRRLASPVVDDRVRLYVSLRLSRVVYLLPVNSFARAVGGSDGERGDGKLDESEKQTARVRDQLKAILEEALLR